MPNYITEFVKQIASRKIERIVEKQQKNPGKPMEEVLNWLVADTLKSSDIPKEDYLASLAMAAFFFGFMQALSLGIESGTVSEDSVTKMLTSIMSENGSIKGKK